MCDLDDSDGECVTVSRRTRVGRSRRPRRCGSCERPIAVGEPYEACAHLYDGEWTSETVCVACADAYSAFLDSHGFAPYSPGWTAQMISECIDNGDEASQSTWRPVLSGLLRWR